MGISPPWICRKSFISLKRTLEYQLSVCRADKLKNTNLNNTSVGSWLAIFLVIYLRINTIRKIERVVDLYSYLTIQNSLHRIDYLKI
ncbi:MAG TPA: hypothetical protein ENK14_02330 [Caldithrix sp.]|nr:hypothetical protein [Caldithrix sp.]